MLLLRVECHSVFALRAFGFCHSSVTLQCRWSRGVTSFEAYTITVMKILNAAVGKRAIV